MKVKRKKEFVMDLNSKKEEVKETVIIEQTPESVEAFSKALHEQLDTKEWKERILAWGEELRKLANRRWVPKEMVMKAIPTDEKDDKEIIFYAFVYHKVMKTKERKRGKIFCRFLVPENDSKG